MTGTTLPLRPPDSVVAPSREGLRIAVPEIHSGLRHGEMNVLFASAGCTDLKIISSLLPKITDLPDVSVRAVLDAELSGQLHQASCHCNTQRNAIREPNNARQIEEEAAYLCEWADLLVLAPIDANNLARMLHGHTDNLLLEILRSWNVSKKVLLVPGMSTLMWENPMTKKQLTKIRRKWNWIQVLQPVLWTFNDAQKDVVSWEAAEELVDTIRNRIDLMNIGQGMDLSPTSRVVFSGTSHNPETLLPPELWSMIFDFTGDWELAQTLHVYTNLPPPLEWASHMSARGQRSYMETLELTILRGNLTDVQHFISTHSVPRRLSKLCIKLIMRFAMTPLLAYFEAKHKDLFWDMFGQTFLPVKASSVFGRTEILEFWRTSPSFLSREYNTEALDGASRAGFVNVLEWWQQSGLPLKFTEAALEQASSQGHVAVLEWWKSQAITIDETSTSTESSKLRLKPGKSICYATQSGHLDVVRWWVRSGIAFTHEDTVAKLASTHGHVGVLQIWHEAKGSKMIYDDQVLVGATKSGHVNVLEWWKQSGLKVEYKTCHVEEALEDGPEGKRGLEIKRWWAMNGLNLGVGTSEWMKTKVLNA